MLRLGELRTYWARVRTDRAERMRFLLGLVAVALVAIGAGRTLAPILADVSTWGGHDWDEISAQRLITVRALRDFHQLPFWNPFACGGHSAWANVQGAPNLVSPFLPFYLAFDLRIALRIELVTLVIVSLSGAFCLARLFTRSSALAGLVAVVFALNGRFAMQAATGHAWHNYYALTPWILWTFHRAVTDSQHWFSRYSLLGSVLIAFLVYAGAIYPLPHTLFLLGIYALVLGVLERRAFPLGVAAVMAMSGLLFAGPKLVPLVELMRRFPRLVESTEFVEIRTLVAALTALDQTPGSRPAPIPQWGWHEYGMYIGWLPFFGLFAAAWARSTHERAARYAGLIAGVLGLGAFHELAPWPLLHSLPMFASQHVPSRWLYPALLLLSLAAVGALERALERRYAWRTACEVGLIAILGFVALDVGIQSARPLGSTFWMKMRPLPAPGEYVQTKRVSRELEYTGRDYAPPALPAMLTNRGVIDCTLMAALNIWAEKDARGRVLGIGAVGRDERGYQGEAFVEGAGRARIERFTPNRVTVNVEGATPGSWVVLNQNYDPGWSADVGSVENHGGRVGARLGAASTQVTFSYRPWGLGLGLLLGALGVALWIRVLRIRVTAYTRRGPRSETR